MHSSKSTFLHRVAAVASLCALLIVGIAFPQQVVFAAGVPTAVLSVPTSGFIGEPMTFTVAFDNTSATDTSYGPYVNLELPAAGIDGAGTATDDGITFTSASYLGTPLTPVIAPFTCAAAGTYVHPLTKLTTTCTPDTQVVILQPPYGSFTATQPPAVMTIVTAVSDLADQNAPLTITAQAGFFLGNDPLDNAGSDPAIIGTTTSATYTPVLFKLKKTYVGPEDETATGPNFVRQYRISVDVANGQTINNLDLTDILPITMQFTTTATLVVTASVGAPTVTVVSTPSTTTPGGTLTRRLSSVVGTLGAEDAVMQFGFYIPRRDAASAVIIDPLTGDDVISQNNASTSGAWMPIDIRDTPRPQAVSIDPAGPEHILTDKSIAIQKSVRDITQTTVTPGDTLEYSLDVQVSDFFAFKGLVISDTFSDGQHFDPTFTPQMQVDGNPFTLAAANINSANYNVAQNYTGAVASAPIFTIDPATNNGKSLVVFRVSDEMITRGQNGQLVGGCVSPTGAGLVSCLGDGPTTLHITFRTVIQDQFTDDYPSGEKNVDEGDKLSNTVKVNGTVLNNVGLTPTANDEDDDSAASIEISRGDLKKTVYAINNNTSCPPSNDCTKAVIAPGDQVTYRLELTVPSSDIEDLKLIDYLPLPIFDVDDNAAPYISRITSFSPVVNAAIPPAGTAKFGPTDTFYAKFNKNPFVAATANDSVANSVTFDYGSFNDVANQPRKIDLLFTVTASNRPFADLLLLTNQVRKQENSTNNGPYITDAIVQVKVNEPDLNIRKGIVAASNPAAVFAPTTKLPAGVTMNMAAAGCAVRQTGTVISLTLPGTFNSNVSNVDANDQLMYGIAIENTGSGPDGAFDVKVKDVLPAGITLVPGSVCATDGTGAVFNTTGNLFSGGLELLDPGPTASPIGGIDPGKSRLNTNPDTTGHNIAIITYLATIDTTVTPGQTLVNTATLFNFGSAEGGPDFTLTDASDTAQATIATPTPSKLLVATSEATTSDAASPPQVTIGEVVRYRVAVQVPEGTSGANVQFLDNLPAGLTFLNDNTAKVAFVSNGGLSSSTLSGVPNYNAAGVTLVDVPSGSVTGALPDAAISSNGSSNVDTYNSGTPPYFSLGTLTNADNDNNAEYVIVDFNALVDNSTAANTAGAQRDNTVSVLINGTQVGATSAATTVRIAEPSLALTKTIVTPASLQGDAGDIVSYRITYTNATGADISTAFDTVVSDVLPSALTLDTASIAVTVTGGATGITNNTAGNTVSVTVASIPPGGSVQVDYSAAIKTTVSSGQVIQNTANLLYTSLPGANGTTVNPTGSSTPGASGATNGERNGSGGINKYNATKTATLTVFVPTPTKTIVTTSEAHTTGNNVAIGEVIRYRVAVRVAEGSSPSFQLRDALPSGLTFLNDGTAKLALASTDPGLSSSTMGAGAQVFPKDETNIAGVVPTFVIPSSAISGGTGTAGAFLNSDDPIFSLGDLTNIDSDADQEFVVIEFNVLTGNIAGNTAGKVLNNTVATWINGNNLATSTPVPVTVTHPQITLAKSVAVTPPVKVGDTVTYTIVATNSGAATSATAFETHILDTLDSNLTFQTVNVTAKPGYATVTNNTAAPNVDLTIDQLRTGDSITIQVTATINAVSVTGQTTPNTANVTYTSLPGTNGTTSNATGTGTPGAAGSSTGERTGAGGVNSYTTSSSAPLALGSIGDTVWYDADGNGALNGVEKGLSNVTVRLTLPGPNGTLGDGDDVTVSTTTDASGQYHFTGLPATTYRVTVDTATLPSGFTAATYDLDGAATASTTSVVLGAAQNRTDADFGYRGTASIGDFVWFDKNGDGLQGVGEPGLANVTITLTWAGQDGIQGNADDISFTQDTNASGGYSFTNLPAGKYTVDVDQTDAPAGTTLTTANDPLNLTLTAGQAYTTADFGFTGTGSLGDRVWLDLNGNGVQDAGEVGLVGVGVNVIWAGPDGTLSTADDITYPATTDAIGNYSVIKLPAGPYRVNVNTATLPAGVSATYDLDGIGTASTVTTLLTNGQNRTDVDFGYRGTASIGDFVWLDQDGDGVQDVGEPGLANVTIMLTWAGQDDVAGNADDRTFTQDTNASGGYSFTNLPAGKYTVDVDQTDAPAGTTLTTANDPLNLTLAAGQAYTIADFGFAGSGALGDRVWLDRNNNGTQDAGEPGLVGVGVNLLWYGKDGLVGGGDDVTYTTTTGADGVYNFTKLPAGKFTVTIAAGNLPAGVTATYDFDGTATASTAAVTLTDGQTHTDVDFGYTGSGSIGDFVWFDKDGDGVQDAGELGLANITVTLTWAGADGTFGNADDLTFTQDTNASGGYNFINLPAGKFTVDVDQTDAPAGTAVTTGNDPLSLTLTSGQIVTTADFGFSGSGSIGDRVWFDINNDGVQDASEPGFSGVGVDVVWSGPDGTLGNTDDVTYTVTTAANGIYGVNNLPAGPYRVNVTTSTLPSGVTASYDLDGIASASTVTTALTTGQTRTDVDFGYAGSGELGDRVWFDSNGNGTQDVGEPGLVGVGVNLLWYGKDDVAGGGDDVTYTTTTGADGVYGFTKLPAGKFVVTITAATLPTGVTTTYDLDGTGTASTTAATLANGQIRTDVDFGYTGSGTIGDFVWLDRNGDGVQDAGEPGLPNITVTLTWAGTDGIAGNADDLTFTQNTNASGGYSFTNLPAGDYTVDVDQTDAPAGTALTTGNDPLNLTLTTGQAVTTVDFGFAGSGSIGDFVWLDRNGDGVQDAGEPGLPGVGVNVVWSGPDGTLGTTDDLTTTVTTDINGGYGVSHLPAGDYRVAINTATLPAGVAASFDLDGGNDSTTITALTTGQNRSDVDFGYAGSGELGNRVWFDSNGNGTQDVGEPGLVGTGVSMVWYGKDGVAGGGDDVTYTTTTGTDGVYTFIKLPAGTFTVTINPATLPTGVTTTYDLDGIGTVSTATTSLTNGQIRTDVDFGYTGSGTIGDFVWLDKNGDGLQDAGEPGLPNVTVTLTWAGADGIPGNADDLTFVKMTDANGGYSFANLPAGDYTVDVDTTTTPVGTSLTTSANPISVTLTTGQADTTADFGFTGSAALGDRVWLDLNGDGVQDTGEPGLVGIGVNVIWAGSDNVLSTTDDVTYTTTTGANGIYGVDNLPAGSYRANIITATLPAGVAASYDLNGGKDGTTTASLTTGQHRDDVDFGYVGSGSIGDFVWLDKDGDGVQDAGEPGLANITVTLTWAGTDGIAGNADDATFTQTTDASGAYSFTGLPAGQYSVDVDQTDAPIGTTLTTSNDPLAVTLTTGQTFTTADFGFTGSAALGDRVWNDVNNNGQQDSSEVGLTGVSVTLTWAGADDIFGTTDDTTYVTTTGVNGIYGFTKLPAGTFRVDVDTATLPAGLNPSYDLDGTATASTITLKLTTGQSVTDADFGYSDLAPPATGLIGDRVWNDLNGNGVQDAGEPGIDNVTVHLTGAGADGVFGTVDDVTNIPAQTTDANGLYAFDKLVPGSYRVTLDGNTLPAGLGASYEQDGSLNGSTDVALTAGAVRRDIDFGFTPASAGAPTGSIGDRVWNDTDGDGVQDAGESGITGVKLTLIWAGPDGIFGNADDTTATTTTGADGAYSFTALPTGLFRVTLDSSTLPAGSNATYELDGSRDGQVTLALTSGQNRSDVDFGYTTSPVTPPTGSIGDRVWNDLNGNGAQDAGEPGLAGITINIVWYGADGVLGGSDDLAYVATTGANGSYNVPNLPAGTFSVSIDPATLPTSAAATFDLDGGNDGTTIVTLTSGQQRTDVDFGYTGTGSLGDRVWNDANANRLQDSTETGISGVDVTLLWAGADGIFGTADDLTRTMVTGTDGVYTFTNLLAGTYRVAVSGAPLGGLNETYELDGSSDATTTVALAIGQSRSDVDFGYTSLKLSAPASLGDRVWLDLDGDGTQNGSEPGIGGVTVNLLSAGADDTFGTADDVSYSQPTDANGAYSFSGLPAGQYKVNVDTGALPAGLGATYDFDGGNDSTTTLTLAAGDNRTDIDFGYRGSAALGDRVWDDLNGDGVQDAGENGINGVTVLLTWTGPDGLLGTADDVSFTTTTAGDGSYSFGYLPAGTYRVAVDQATLPAGMLATYDLDGALNSIASVGLTIGQQRDDVDFGYVVPVIDLQLTKTANGTATAGSTLVYTLAYTNAGNFATDGVVIHETVPAHTTFNVAGSTAGWSCAGTTAGSACTFAVGTLPRLGHGHVLFAVTLPNPVPAGVDSISNTASIVDNAAHGADATPPNNTAGVTTLVDAAPDLQLSKSDGGNQVRAGQPITYTLSYTNVGTQDATGVVITETVSAHTTFSATGSQTGWTCNGTGAGSICTFTVGNLAAGQSGNVQFVTVVENPLTGGANSIVNTASIGDDGSNGADPTGPGNRLNNNVAGVTSPLAPTAITLTRFTATRANNGVVVRWTTTSEQDTFGFRLYRSNDNDRSHATLVTPTFILGQGRDGGASYSWTDSSAQAGSTYSYWLEEVDLNNQSAFYGPVRVSEGISTSTYQVLLPIVKR